MLPNFYLFEKNDFQLTQSLPADWRGLILRGASVLTARNDTGIMVLQEAIEPEYSIRFNVFNFLQPVKIAGQFNSSLMMSLLALKNNIHWSIKGFRALHLKQGQFSLLHTMDRELTAHFDKNKIYHTLEIEWSPERIREVEPYFPFLKPLFETAKENKSRFVSRPAIEAGHEVLDVARDILSSPYDNAYNQIFLSNKIREYLSVMMIVASREKKPLIKLTDEERKIILEIADMLSHQYNKRFPIEWLARQAGMNQMKFKMGFKAVTGKPVFQYHLAARMMEAHRLLRETGHNIKLISEMVNYKRPSDFLEEFLKYFDYSAGSLRKNK